jgi:hypothetical protein
MVCTGPFSDPRRSVRIGQLQPNVCGSLTELVENLMQLFLRALLPDMAVDKFASDRQ